MRFSDFVTISPSTKKEIELVVSIFEDGTFSLNSYLLKYFPQYTAEIKFPIYYMGEWDDQNEWWIGNMVSVNPNKPRKR